MEKEQGLVLLNSLDTVRDKNYVIKHNIIFKRYQGVKKFYDEKRNRC